ncbi:hypothetical protein ACFL6R_06945, partial [Gemmatimonadota bacterium]
SSSRRDPGALIANRPATGTVHHDHHAQGSTIARLRKAVRSSNDRRLPEKAFSLRFESSIRD